MCSCQRERQLCRSFFYLLLLSRKIAGHIATILTLLVGLVMAVVVYSMPIGLAGMAGLYGILNGLFPIGWIVLCAVFFITSASKLAVLPSCATVSNQYADRRIELLIAFCFGAFLEGAAGFGAPVAITVGMNRGTRL